MCLPSVSLSLTFQQMSHRKEGNSVIYDSVGFDLEDVGVAIRHTLDYKSMVHINGNPEYLDEGYQVNPKTILQKSSTTQYRLKSSSTNVSVTVTSSSMNVDVSVLKSECCENVEFGLCGTCATSCPGISQISAKRGSSVGSFANVHDESESSLLTDKSDIIFFENDPGYEAPSGGYALQFIDATVAVNDITLSPTRYTTVALYVKTCDQGCGGTLLSYSHQFTFYVSTASGFFSLHFNDQMYETDLTVTSESWQQVVLVFDQTTLLLDFYVIYPADNMKRRPWQLSGDIFPEGGSLGLGVWLPPSIGSGAVPVGSFSGTLDNIRVWERSVN